MALMYSADWSTPKSEIKSEVDNMLLRQLSCHKDTAQGTRSLCLYIIRAPCMEASNILWTSDLISEQEWASLVFCPWLRRQYTSDTPSETLFSTQHLHITWWAPANWRGSDKTGPMGGQRWIWSVWHTVTHTVTCQWLKKGKADSVMVWDGLQLLLRAPGWDHHQSQC